MNQRLFLTFVSVLQLYPQSSIALSAVRAANKESAYLVCPHPIFDAGERFIGESAEHEFIIRNVAKSYIRIEKIKSSCLCTEHSIGKMELGPKEETTLQVKLKSDRVGPRTAEIIIFSDITEKPLQVKLSANFTSDFVLKPQVLDFGEFHLNEKVSKNLAIVLTAPEKIHDITIHDVIIDQNNPSKISLEIELLDQWIKEDCNGTSLLKRNLLVYVTSKYTLGSFIINAQIPVQIQDRPTKIPFTIKGYVVGPVTIYPSTGLFAITERRGKLKKKVKLTLPEKYNPTGVMSDSPLVTANIEQLPQANEYLVSWNISPSAPHGLLKFNTIVYTKGLNDLTILIPGYIKLHKPQSHAHNESIKPIGILRIYNEAADGKVQIKKALSEARIKNKQVLLNLGTNSCKWCTRLHKLFHDHEKIRKLLEEHYILVPIDVHNRHNIEVDEIYGHPTKFGVPVLVLLSDKEESMHIQNTAVWESGKGHDPNKIIEFLLKWSTPLNHKKQL